MKDKHLIKIGLESNPEFRFQAIYEGLQLVLKREKANTEPGKFSLVGAEAYCILEDLKVTHPRQFEQARMCCPL